jgi:hypothetical protein
MTGFFHPSFCCTRHHAWLSIHTTHTSRSWYSGKSTNLLFELLFSNNSPRMSSRSKAGGNSETRANKGVRVIAHIDMDCFFVQVQLSDSFFGKT